MLSFSTSKSLLYGTLSILMNVLCTLQQQQRQHPFPVFVCVVWYVFGLLCVDRSIIDFYLGLALAFISLMANENEQAVFSSLLQFDRVRVADNDDATNVSVLMLVRR